MSCKVNSAPSSVQDLPETVEAAASFGFTADDIGDYLFDVLASYGHDFSSLEFLTGDNAYVNGADRSVDLSQQRHPPERSPCWMRVAQT